MRTTGVSLFCLLWVAIASFQCSRDKMDPQEEILNLRAIGVSATPTLAPLLQDITFTFYALTPKGQTVSFATYTDSRMSQPLQPPVLPTTEVVLSKGALDLHQISGAYSMDTPISAAGISADPGYTTLDYGLVLTTSGKREPIFGSVVFFNPSHPAYEWQNHGVSITNLEEGQSVSGQDLELQAKITGRNAEDYRIGWFISSGTIANRRSLLTTSTDMKSGVQTIVVTARGRLSGKFAYAMIDVNVK